MVAAQPQFKRQFFFAAVCRLSWIFLRVLRFGLPFANTRFHYALWLLFWVCCNETRHRRIWANNTERLHQEWYCYIITATTTIPSRINVRWLGETVNCELTEPFTLKFLISSWWWGRRREEEDFNKVAWLWHPVFGQWRMELKCSAMIRWWDGWRAGNIVVSALTVNHRRTCNLVQIFCFHRLIEARMCNWLMLVRPFVFGLASPFDVHPDWQLIIESSTDLCLLLSHWIIRTWTNEAQPIDSVLQWIDQFFFEKMPH